MQKSNAPPNRGGSKGSFSFSASKPSGGQVGSYRKVKSGYGVPGHTGRGTPMPKGEHIKGPGYK